MAAAHTLAATTEEIRRYVSRFNTERAKA